MKKLQCPFCKTQLSDSDHYIGTNYLCPNDQCLEIVIAESVTVKEEKIDRGLADCFGYWDGRDPSCRRCMLAADCQTKFEDTRPECFGLLHGSQDCGRCLDESQCVETHKQNKETGKMAKRKTRVRRTQREAKAPVVEEVVVAEDAAEENEDDYSEWAIPDLRAELETRELKTDGRKSVLIKRLMANDAVDEDEEEELDAEADEEEAEPMDEEELEAEAPAPKPRRASRRKRTRVKDVVKEQDPGDEEPVAATEAPIVAELTPMSELATAIIAVLDAGKAVTVTARTDGYTLTLGTAAPVALNVAEEAAEEAPKGKGLRGDAFYAEVWTEDYWAFMKEDAGGSGKPWEKMDKDDKYALADELEIEWDEHDDDRVDMMQMFKALTHELGIQKYKGEYSSPAARKALR